MENTKDEQGRTLPKFRNPNGRKPIYETPEELQEKVDEYMNLCFIMDAYEKEFFYDENGDEQFRMVPCPKMVNKPSITGLQTQLGFSSANTLTNYSKKNPEFAEVIEGAKDVIKKFHEDNLSTKYANGAKWILSAMWGYSEKTEVVNKTVEYEVDFSSLD